MWNGSWVSLKGDLILCCSLVTLEALDRSFQVEGYGILIEFCRVAMNNGVASKEPFSEVIHALLNQFS